MRSLRTPALKLAVLLALAAPALALATQYVAIAYSPTTGKYGKSGNCATRAEAEKAAIAECGATDAKALTWSSGGWSCALAVDPNDPAVYGYGSGNSAAKARLWALEECRKRSKNPAACRVVTYGTAGIGPSGGWRCYRCGCTTLPGSTVCRGCDVRK